MKMIIRLGMSIVLLITLSLNGAAYGATIHIQASGVIIRPNDFVPSIKAGDPWHVSYSIDADARDLYPSNTAFSLARGWFTGMTGLVTLSDYSIPLRMSRASGPTDQLLEGGSVHILVESPASRGGSIVSFNAEKIRPERPLIDGRELIQVSTSLVTNLYFENDFLINTANISMSDVLPSPPVWEDDGVADTQASFRFISGQGLREFIIGRVTRFESYVLGEPGTFALYAIGLAGIALRRKMRLCG